MEAIKGTKVKGKTIPTGHVVDCRNWLEFAIVEHLVKGDRIAYRVPDIDFVEPEKLESGRECPCLPLEDT